MAVARSSAPRATIFRGEGLLDIRDGTCMSDMDGWAIGRLMSFLLTPLSLELPSDVLPRLRLRLRLLKLNVGDNLCCFRFVGGVAVTWTEYSGVNGSNSRKFSLLLLNRNAVFGSEPLSVD